MSQIGDIDLSKVPVEELKTMQDAGECVRECYRVLKRTNDSIVSEYLKRHDAMSAANQISPGPIIDRKTNSQYWFHNDTVEQRPQETGHFHTFVSPRRIPRIASPAPADKPGSRNDTGENLCHIVAIAMDHTGFPVRLFAPNKWVTGADWLKAADVCHHLTYFTIDHAEPSYPVNVWLTNMLVLFRPQIRELLTARDKLIATRRQQQPEEDVLEDRGLAVTVERTIDVMRQLNTVRESLRMRTVSTKRTARIINAADAAMKADAWPAQSAAPATQTREQAVEVALQAQIQTLHNAVLSAKTTAHALEEQVETARRQAWQREKEHERERAGLLENHASDLSRQLTEAAHRFQAAYGKKLASARAEWQVETTARMDSVRKETQDLVLAARASAIVDLRAQWQMESQKILAEVIDLRKVEEAKRLTAAKDKWDIARREALTERDRIWKVAFEHRVEEALVAWRDEETTRFAQAKAAWSAERKYRDAKRRRIGLWLRRIVGVLLIAAIIGGGATLYPTAKAFAAEIWENVVVTNWMAMKTRISASIYTPDDPSQVENGAPGGTRTDKSKPAKPNVPQSYIKPNAANLRGEPSRIGNVIGILRRGAQVTRLDRRGRWVQIRVADEPGKIGWVHASLLADRPARNTKDR